MCTDHCACYDVQIVEGIMRRQHGLISSRHTYMHAHIPYIRGVPERLEHLEATTPRSGRKRKAMENMRRVEEW